MTYYELRDWSQPVDALTIWERHPGVVATYAVPSSDGETAYLVREIECLSKPFEEADVAADQVTIHVCSCEDFEYRKWYGSEPDEIANPQTCKHINALKSERATADESQVTLGETNG